MEINDKMVGRILVTYLNELKGRGFYPANSDGFRLPNRALSRLLDRRHAF